MGHGWEPLDGGGILSQIGTVIVVGIFVMILLDDKIREWKMRK